jgi:hypothetical protein
MRHTHMLLLATTRASTALACCSRLSLDTCSWSKGTSLAKGVDAHTNGHAQVIR